MRILAIETSCEIASIALLDGDEAIERRLEGHTNHSDRLLPTLRALLADAGLPLAALDAIAFGAGPGAFTGLRLACGVAQGLGMGVQLPVAPVCSLAALAMQGAAENVFVATDARMGEVYSAAYRVRRGTPEEIAPPVCTPPQQVSLPPGGRWFAIGSALKAYERDLRTAFGERIEGWLGEAVPRAADVARLAAQPKGRACWVPPELAAPIYVRDKVALTTAERRQRGGRA